MLPLGALGETFFFFESAQCPGDLGLSNMQINVLEILHLSGAVLTYSAAVG